MKKHRKILNTQNNKGITLVALVITIIVLLILAVIAIRTITDDSIINYAKNASAEYKLSEEEENSKLENYLEIIDESVPLNVETIPAAQSYVGYYADINGDNTVDGIIYADFATGSSGEWGTEGLGKYTVAKKENLDKYYIIKGEHQESGFPAKPVIAPVNKKAINDRFYVMALSDFTDGTNTKFSWYTNALVDNVGLMTDFESATSADFETGRANSITMIDKIYGNGLVDGDIWKQARSKITEGWFVPSNAEWSAFVVNLGITAAERSNYALNDTYWTSTQYNSCTACLADFVDIDEIGAFWGPFTQYSIRLSTTF